MASENVDCPHCGESTAVTLEGNREVRRTTPSRTAVGLMSKPNVTSVTCPNGHRFYVEYSTTA